jgi:hypothetical protein
MDGDGDLDAFILNKRSPQVRINDGTGTFFDSGARSGRAYSLGIELGDLNGDGDLDAFMTNSTFPNPVLDRFNRIWLNNRP